MLGTCSILILLVERGTYETSVLHPRGSLKMSAKSFIKINENVRAVPKTQK